MRDIGDFKAPYIFSVDAKEPKEIVGDRSIDELRSNVVGVTYLGTKVESSARLVQNTATRLASAYDPNCARL